MKAVELLVRSLLPDDVKESLNGFDDKSINTMLVDLYKKHPDTYRDLSHRIARIGREASYKQGESVGLSDLLPVVDKKPILDSMDREVAALAREFKNDPEEFARRRESVWFKYNDILIKSTMDNAKKAHNNFGFSVSSGARGKPVQIQAMLTTPGLYQDSEGKTIPVFIRNSFSEGLRPYEFLAGSYGARSSVISTKTATAKGGDFGKLAAQASSRVVVTTDDCGANNGIPYETGDDTVRNRILVKDTGTLKAGTLLDRPALAQLKKEGVTKLIARSPLTCKADGVCSKCVGKTFDNRFTKVGEHIGITAANAMCLAGSTQVMMCDGTWKNIQDIYTGESVMGLNKDGTYSPTKVTNVWQKGWQECNTYTFTSYDRTEDLTVTCTPNHTFLLEEYDTETHTSGKPFEAAIGTLKVNSKGKRLRAGLSLPRNHTVIDGVKNEPLALVIGCMLGDGTLGDTKGGGSARFSSFDPLLSVELGEHLETVGMRLTGGKEDRTGTLNIGVELGQNPTANKLRERCRELRIWGCRTHNKYVPEEVFTEWDHESVCKFIAGLFITDGYVSTRGDRLEFTSVSHNLAHGLSRLIKQRLMIPGVFINKYMRENKQRGTKEPEYCLRVRNANGMRYLAQAIEPYMIGKKKAAIRTVLSKLPPFSDVRHVAFLKKVEPIGTLRTWDLAVDNETHMFVIQGLISTHNSEPVTQGALSCLREGTLVKMADLSVKPIEAIQVGDMVLGANEDGKTFPSKVTATHNQGLQEVYKFDYRIGNTARVISVECTEDHKILSNTKTYGETNGKNNEVTQKLKAGVKHSCVGAVLPTEVNFVGQKKAEPLALFLGIFAGDGIRWSSDVKKQSSVLISCADLHLVEDLNNYFHDFNLTMKKSKRSYDWRIVYPTASSAHRPENKHVLKSVLKKYEYADKYAHNKGMPFGWRNWDMEAMKNFLAGYIATDGCIRFSSENKKSASVSFTSTSLELIKGLVGVVEDYLCVYGNRIYCNEGIKEKRRPIYSYTVSRADQVLKLLTLLPPIPGVKKFVQQNIIEEFSQLELRHKEKFSRAMRSDVTYVGKLPCYDISVEHESELFVLANSIIVSNSKHTAGQGKERAAYGGFEILSQFVQSPTEYLHKATVSEDEGIVSNIREAQQGGYFVTVNERDHYVPVGYPVTVKVGDNVEAGDALSEGIVDVRDIVNHKGLGAARKYYVERLAQIYDDSGMKVSKKNLELFTRGALNTVVLDDEIEDLDNLPDDTIDYVTAARAWKPKTVVDADLNSAKYQYLAEDTLQHTVGTRLTPKMLAELGENGVSKLRVTNEKPPFTSNMDRLRTASHSNEDWLASMSTSYLKDQLREGAVRGADTNYLENRHYAPRLGYGVGDTPQSGFGQKTDKEGLF